jgi:hypothetical protein
MSEPFCSVIKHRKACFCFPYLVFFLLVNHIILSASQESHNKIDANMRSEKNVMLSVSEASLNSINSAIDETRRRSNCASLVS